MTTRGIPGAEKDARSRQEFCPGWVPATFAVVLRHNKMAVQPGQPRADGRGEPGPGCPAGTGTLSARSISEAAPEGSGKGGRSRQEQSAAAAPLPGSAPSPEAGCPSHLPHRRTREGVKARGG